MIDSTAMKRSSLRRALSLATVVMASTATVAPYSARLRAEEPSRTPLRLEPKRLPAVVDEGESRSARPDAARLVELVQAEKVKRKPVKDAGVQTCSAEFDALVDSWLEAGDEEKRIAPQRWLRSTSATASTDVARRLIVQADREFKIKAWVSAETSAWNAIRWAAESVDLAAREQGENPSPSALQRLQMARDAMREAREFAGVFGPLDAEAIHRMAISHQTDLLDDEPLTGLTATDAADRYLDHARVLLAPVASQSVEAAAAMDLLASIYLHRADPKTLPSATALCLRRAALQGQPDNASLAARLGMHLADLGLFQEARWALEHSLAIKDDPQTTAALVQLLQRSGRPEEAEPLLSQLQNQLHGQSRLASGSLSGDPDRGLAFGAPRSTPRLPEIVELTPDAFAKISKPVNPVARVERRVEATPASTRLEKSPDKIEPEEKAAPSQEQSKAVGEEKVGWMHRLFRPFKQVW